MAGSVFWLKLRDTRPVLEVALKNPDGSAHDLTGSTVWKLHILLSDGSTKLVRDMVIFGASANGILRYTWIATDWDASASLVNGSYSVGGLVVGPTLPLAKTAVEHRMEYEVVNGTLRLTFPNDGYDTLRILADIGQG